MKDPVPDPDPVKDPVKDPDPDPELVKEDPDPVEDYYALEPVPLTIGPVPLLRSVRLSRPRPNRPLPLPESN